MRLTSLLLAVSGLAVAGGTAYVARDILQAQNASAAPAAEQATVRVIVAGRDIALGQSIEPQLLSSIEWPREAVPDGVFTDMSVLIPALGGEPRRARRAISKGEVLLSSKVSDFGEKVTIVQTLDDNHRAMAIQVKAETGVGGFVTPGDYVDVVLTHGRDTTLRAVTILQNIRVIGVDQSADERSDTPEVARTITVAVSPEESQRLALAQQAGTLSLALRNQAIAQDSPLDSIRLSDLLREVSPVPEPEKTPVIRVRRANVLSTEQMN